jgi:hypothetical protein
VNDNKKGGIGILFMLLFAGTFALANLMMMGIPGIAIFQIADVPLTFLPQYQSDYWGLIGLTYGTIWPLLMFAVYVAGVNRGVPEKWKTSPRIYKVGYVFMLAAIVSVILALPIHLYASWKTYGHEHVSQRGQN